MKLDIYTKAVLTVIAISLSVIAFRATPLVAEAQAQSGPVHVILDSVGTYAFQFATVPVRVTNP